MTVEITTFTKQCLDLIKGMKDHKCTEYRVNRKTAGRGGLLLVFCLMLSHMALAASEGDFFQDVGKMYVVTAVICVTFIGLCIYLVRLDRKISSLEEKLKR